MHAHYLSRDLSRYLSRYLQACFLFWVAFVSGCGGSGGGAASDSPASAADPSPFEPVVLPSAEGIWLGTLDNTAGQQLLFGAVAPDGLSVFMDSSDQTLFTFGALSGGTSVTGSWRAFAQQGIQAVGTANNILDLGFSGALTAQQALTGTLGSGFALNLAYQAADYERDFPISALAGEYAGFSDDGARAAFSILSNGRITGAVDYPKATCLITGSAQQITPGKNLFSIQANVNTLGCDTGDYQGLAFVASDDTSIFIGLLRNANATAFVGFKVTAP